MLEYCSTVWNPYIPARHYLGMTDQLENVQQFFMHQVYHRCQLDTNHGYPQRLEYHKLESLEFRRIYNDMVMVYNIMHGHINVSENNIISWCKTPRPECCVELVNTTSQLLHSNDFIGCQLSFPLNQCLLTFNALDGRGPQYLSEKLTTRNVHYGLRSLEALTLNIQSG